MDSVQELMFKSACLLRELGNYCVDRQVRQRILSIQQGVLYRELNGIEKTKKDIAWDILMQTGDHKAATGFLKAYI